MTLPYRADINTDPSLSANSGAAAGGILFFITYIPNFFIQMRYQDINGPTKWASSILHNVAMSYGCTQIAAYEGAGTRAIILMAYVHDCFVLCFVVVSWSVSVIHVIYLHTFPRGAFQNHLWALKSKSSYIFMSE